MTFLVQRLAACLPALALVLLCTTANAHFLWLKSSLSDQGARAVISFGESPAVEDYNLPESVEKTALWWRGNNDKTHDLEAERIDTDDRIVLESPLPSGDSRVLEATCTYGLYHGTLLKYYTKHVSCKSAEELGSFGPSKKLKLDIVPAATKEGLELTVYWEGKPLPGAKLTLTDSEEEEQSATTSPKGVAQFQTPAKGLVAVLANYQEKKNAGVFEGEAYKGIANYVTLTFDSYAEKSTTEPTPAPAPKRELAAGEIPPLPEPIASFGAAVQDGWLYVYSGHTGGAHEHSNENLSSHFSRVNLAGGQEWESLEFQLALQGFPLVAHGNSLYRVGGMFAKNSPEEDDDLYGVADFSRFDVESKTWTALPALPAPRSSHDAVVIGDKLYVAGGWHLDGADEGDWHSNALVFDLTKPEGTWEALPEQPFERRALATSHWQGKLVVVGGIDSGGEVSREFNLYDPASKTWSTGPEIPGERMGGFGISAWNHNDKLYISGLDGIIHCLSDDGKSWQAATEVATPRFFHRLLPAGEKKLLIVGGASFESGHLDDVEIIDLNAPAKKADNAAATTEPGDDKSASAAPGSVWPAFRGLGNSRTAATNLPTEWSDQAGIAWQTELPGYGQASPVVWHDRVFVTTMQGENKETPTILCFDLATGAEQWRKELVSTQTVPASNYVTRGSPTPVVDSKALYTFFESGELAAFDHKGSLIWQRSLVKEYGTFQGNHGIGSSLAATEDAVIVLVNHDAPSYLMAVDKSTGENLWKVDYDNRVAWSSPIVAQYEGHTSVIVSASGIVEAYNADDGQKLWSHEGLTGNNVPSATLNGNTIYIGSKDKDSNLALQVDNTQAPPTATLKWKTQKPTCSFSSPLFHRGLVYFVSRAGVAFCVDSTNGETLWNHRLGESCWASPLGAGDHIYFFTKSGDSTIVKAGSSLEVIAENALTVPAETRIYGYAALDNKFVLRTGSQLVCLGE